MSRHLPRRAHADLVGDIRRQIRAGILRANHYLLSERELAQKYRVSSRAVREGLAGLEAEGLIRRHQGRGTVVLAQEVEEAAAAVKHIGVVFQGRVRDSSTAEVLDQFQQAFQEEQYGTILYTADRSPEKEVELIDRMAAEKVPGMVLFSCHPTDSYGHLQRALESGMKIVVFDHDFPDLPINFVGIDDRAAAFEATEHLLRLGCREMMLINSEAQWTTHRLREEGFEQAMAKYGEGLPRRVIHLPDLRVADHLGQSLREHLLPLLGGLQRPVGIVAWWDEVALRAIQCLQEAGWSVPGDARVVGFANDIAGERAPVPLTTMEIPRQAISRMAATLLLNQIRDPERAPRRVRLKARMILRESCGTYAGSARQGTGARLSQSPGAQSRGTQSQGASSAEQI